MCASWPNTVFVESQVGNRSRTRHDIMQPAYFDQLLTSFVSNVEYKNLAMNVVEFCSSLHCVLSFST